MFSLCSHYERCGWPQNDIPYWHWHLGKWKNQFSWFSSHSTGCLRQKRKEKKEKKGERERLWEIKHIFFALLNPLYKWFTGCGCVKLLKCYLHNPLIVIKNSEEMDLLGIWYIVFQYIYTIYSAVFVMKNVNSVRHSHIYLQVNWVTRCTTCCQCSKILKRLFCLFFFVVLWILVYLCDL